MKKTLATASAIALATLAAIPATAQDQGSMTLAFGLGYVRPQDDNGPRAGPTPIDVSNDTRPTLAFEYFVRDNVGIEVLAATPFKHSIYSNGVYIGETKHLPPTVSVNYHIPTGGKVTPFIGAGINYTIFFDESTPLGTLGIENSFGFALHAGADYELSDKAAIRADLRYIQIEPDVTLNGVAMGSAKINPLVAGIAYVMKF